jgi:hypothetical protein
MVKEAIRKSLLNMRTLAEKMPPGAPGETADTRYHMLRIWSSGTRTPLPENCERVAEALVEHRRDLDQAIETLQRAAKRGG